MTVHVMATDHSNPRVEVIRNEQGEPCEVRLPAGYGLAHLRAVKKALVPFGAQWLMVEPWDGWERVGACKVIPIVDRATHVPTGHPCHDPAGHPTTCLCYLPEPVSVGSPHLSVALAAQGVAIN